MFLHMGDKAMRGDKCFTTKVTSVLTIGQLKTNNTLVSIAGNRNRLLRRENNTKHMVNSIYSQLSP